MACRDNNRIVVVGLGYVGLPIAVEFGKIRPVIGFDVDVQRVQDLRRGVDKTREVDRSVLKASSHLKYCSPDDDLGTEGNTIFIVCVPTPVRDDKVPDTRPLVQASKFVGSVMCSGDLVIYESTVYPGCTEEICVPELERSSGLVFNKDLHCGYSPERLVPGDKARRLDNVVKLTSGSTPEIADQVDALYSQIVKAGTYKTSSMRIAEAAKVIENVQRDVNIGLMNELANVFEHLKIDTKEVLDAASTKWNFLPFSPGLVGGHCIGVDPYYLTYKAQKVGYQPELILAARQLNNGMAERVARSLVKEMNEKSINVEGSKILIMGVTFKEDCPDTRNSKVYDVSQELKARGSKVEMYDPWVNQDDIFSGENLFVTELKPKFYDAILLTVPHSIFLEKGSDWIREAGGVPHVFFDVKSAFSLNESDLRL